MNTTAMAEKAEQLRELGFDKAAEDLRKKAELGRRLSIAYEHYRYVKQEKIDAYKEKLRKATTRRMTIEELRMHPTYRAAMDDGRRWNGRAMSEAQIEQLVLSKTTSSYDTLVLDTLSNYQGIPPQAALDKLAEAKGLKVFDTFEVAHVDPVASQVKLPDPIIFGLINGCTDRFFIAEWGDDVKLTDLIGASEG